MSKSSKSLYRDHSNWHRAVEHHKKMAAHHRVEMLSADDPKFHARRMRHHEEIVTYLTHGKHHGPEYHPVMPSHGRTREKMRSHHNAMADYHFKNGRVSSGMMHMKIAHDYGDSMLRHRQHVVSNIMHTTKVNAHDVHKSAHYRMSEWISKSTGKVPPLGYTRSGKPVYTTPNHKEHKGFSNEDHYDAMAIHFHHANNPPRTHAEGKKFDAHWDKHTKAGQRHESAMKYDYRSGEEASKHGRRSPMNEKLAGYGGTLVNKPEDVKKGERMETARDRLIDWLNKGPKYRNFPSMKHAMQYHSEKMDHHDKQMSPLTGKSDKASVKKYDHHEKQYSHHENVVHMMNEARRIKHKPKMPKPVSDKAAHHDNMQAYHTSMGDYHLTRGKVADGMKHYKKAEHHFNKMEAAEPWDTRAPKRG